MQRNNASEEFKQLSQGRVGAALHPETWVLPSTLICENSASNLGAVGMRESALWPLEQSFSWTEVGAEYLKRYRKDLKFLDIFLCPFPT